jgi:hypothetical protein
MVTRGDMTLIQGAIFKTLIQNSVMECILHVFQHSGLRPMVMLWNVEITSTLTQVA